MIVLDCSAAVSIVHATPDGRALQSLLLSEERIISPALFHAEIASALKKYVTAGLLDHKQALDYIDDAVCLVDAFYDMADCRTEAFAESVRLGHSIYDMFYFILARRNAATLCTLDRRLIQLCEQQGIDCIHILAD